MELRTAEVLKSRDLSKFIKFPWKIYRNDAFWVPPLLREVHRKLNPEKNPFFEYGKVRLFLVFDNHHEAVGRIAAIFNPVHCEIYHERTGFFGLFECIDSIEVAKRLVEAVNSYLCSFDCQKVIGPVNFTTNDDSGLLIEGNKESPTIMCSYTPSYYPDLLTACGFEKAIDLFSYVGNLGHTFPEKYMKVVQRAASNKDLVTRPFNKHKLSADIAVFREIYNQSFKELWGFLPLTLSEVEEMARSMIPFTDYDLVWIAEYKKKPVGIILALPDVNEVLKDLNGRLFPFGIFKFLLKRRRIKGARVLVLGVLPEYRSIGIETLLIYRVHTRLLARGCQRAEFSVVNDTNTKMRKVLEGLGFQVNKRYRLYQAPLDRNLGSGLTLTSRTS